MVAGVGAKNLSSQQSLEEIERRVLARIQSLQPDKFQHVANEPQTQSSTVREAKADGEGYHYDQSTQDRISNLERVVLKRSIFSLRSEIIMFFTIGALNLLFNAQGWPGFLVSTSIPVSVSEFHIVFPWAMVVMAFLAVRIYFKMENHAYTLGRRHLRALSGNYAVQRTEVEIPYESILFVEVNQNLIDRLFRVGTIQAGRNTETKSEIVMRGVRYPHKWVKVIKQRMNIAKGVADKEEFLD